MKKLAKTLADFAAEFAPPAPVAAKIDLDSIAETGRRALWETEQRRMKTGFHPSQLADPCLRFDTLRLMVLDPLVSDEELLAESGIVRLPEWGAPMVTAEQFDYGLHRSFDVGTALHEMEQNKYFGHSGRLLGTWRCSNCHQETGQLVHKPDDPCPNRTVVYHGRERQEERLCEERGAWDYVEARVRNLDLSVFGRVDLVIDHPGSRKLTVVDIKTTASKRFAELTEPQAKDMIQLQIYLWLMEASHGVLRYLDQGDPRATPKHFQVDNDPRIGNWVKQYIKDVNELVEERRWQAASTVCAKPTLARAKRCPFNHICFEKEAA